MGFDALVRKGYAIANSLTESLRAEISHEAFTSIDSYAAPTYASAKKRYGLVEMNPRAIRNAQGEVIAPRAKIDFFEPFEIGVQDRITLPDGTTGPILRVGGLADPTTDAVYAPTVWIGWGPESAG